jgi:hypothetical protein
MPLSAVLEKSTKGITELERKLLGNKKVEKAFSVDS